MAMHHRLLQFNFNLSDNCIYADQQFTIQIMKSLSINPAISFCSLTPAASHQVSLILSTPGPKLEQLTTSDCTLPDTHKLRCANFLENIQQKGQKEIIFMGTGKQSFLRSISFMLLALAYKQVNNYPHLLTLIKQQFFKPGVFAEMDKKKSVRILNICHNIEIEMISCETVTQFCENNEQFMLGFYHVLIKIINQSQKFDCQKAIEKIRHKFQIDCKKMFTQESEVLCWAFGLQKKIYLFYEGEYLILVSTCTLDTNYPNHLDSHIQTRLESQRDFSDIGQLVIPEASEQSTPKFKQNQQSIRYRKKSHKNSFGGQFEASTYNQLANLLNRSQVQNTKIRQKQAKKVFSVKFDMRNREGDDQQNGTWLNIENQENKNEKIVEGCNILKNQTQMRNSNIEGNQGRTNLNEFGNQEKGEKKKHLTSSEMHELRKDMQSGTSDAQLKQQKTKSNSNNSNALSGQQQIKVGEGTTKGNQYLFPGMNLQNWKSKEGFKFSFSKKDSSRFIFKQIQSEYNEEHLPEHPETPSESYPIPKAHEPMKSSLTNLNSANHYIGLLLEGEYFKKKQNNRKSLFIESSMSPIKQQVQSSQQEDQSASQSFRDQEKDDQQQFIENEPVAPPIKQIPKDANKRSFWSEKQKNGQKNYIKIFKPKNRKCSYLTQQMSTQKNTGISANDELRQNDYNIAESSPFSPTTNPYSLKNQQDTSRNRVKKPAKIHKNSEAITESRSNKKRFQQNPISFSQMIANVSQPEDSHFSGFSFPKQKRQPKLSLTSNVSQFSKNPSFNVWEPEGWVRKQVIYFFDTGIHNQFSNQYRRPEKYIFQRSPAKHHHHQQESNSIQSQVQQIGLNNDQSQPLLHMQKLQQKISQSPLNQTKERTVEVKQQGNTYQKGFLQYLERLGSPQNNVRSTIDTSKNTNAFSIRQFSNQPIQQNQPKAWIYNLNPEQRMVAQSSLNVTSSPSKFGNTGNFPVWPQNSHYHLSNSGPPYEKSIDNQHSPKFVYSPKGSPVPSNIIRNNPRMVSNGRVYANTSARKQLSPTLIINNPNFYSMTNPNYGAHHIVQKIEHRSLSPSSTIYSDNRRIIANHEAKQIRHASYSTANLLSQPTMGHRPQIQKYSINAKNIGYQPNIQFHQNYSQQNSSMFRMPHKF